MLNDGDEELEEENEDDDEDDEQDRGFMLRPQGDACPRGHVDWEIIQRRKKLIRRCRRCGFVVDFKGKVIP